MPAGSGDVALVHGGKIALSAPDSVALGQNTLLDVTGGGRLKVDGRGKVIAGNGGEISLTGNAVSGLGENRARLWHRQRRHAHGFQQQDSNRRGAGQLGRHGQPGCGIFRAGRFRQHQSCRNGSPDVSQGVRIRPTVLSLELQPGYTVRPSGSRVEDFTRQIKLDDLVRQPVNLSLKAENPADGTGDLVIGAGAQIEADPKANITLKAAHLLDIEGRITAPGGTITATLDHRHDFNFDPRNSLWLGNRRCSMSRAWRSPISTTSA